MEKDLIETTKRAPTCFISYSWDTAKHQEWVLMLAYKLHKSGIFTQLDVWDVKGGADLPSFMEKAITDSDHVLVVCTPKYALRAKEGEGGVGYENCIITGQVFRACAEPTKFIPILRSGSSKNAIPAYLGGKKYFDFTDDKVFSSKFNDLLRDLLGKPLHPRPQLGILPPLDAEPDPIPPLPAPEPTHEDRHSSASPLGLRLASTLKSLGDAKTRLGEVDGARDYYTEAVKLFTKEHSDLGIANVLRSLGDLESRLGEVDGARDHYTEAVKLFTKEHSDLGLANVLKSLGNLESRLGEVDGARDHYMEAQKLFTKEHSDLGLANVLRSLGDLESRVKKNDTARDRYTEAIKLYTKQQASLGLANTLVSLGNLENRLGEIEGAREHYTKAAKLYTKQRNNLGLANTLRSIGNLELTLRRFPQAKVHYVKARGFYIAERDMTGLACTDAELARVAHALEQTAEADQYLDEGIRAAQTSNVPSVVRYVAKARTEIHPGAGKHNGEPGA